MKGDHHRKQRKMLNPVFSIAHLRQMSKDVSFSKNHLTVIPLLVPMFYEVTHKVTVFSTGEDAVIYHLLGRERP